MIDLSLFNQIYLNILIYFNPLLEINFLYFYLLSLTQPMKYPLSESWWQNVLFVLYILKLGLTKFQIWASHIWTKLGKRNKKPTWI